MFFSKSDGDPVSRWKSFSFWYWKWGGGLVDSPICSNYSLKLKLWLWKISTLVWVQAWKKTSPFSFWWVVIDAIAPKEYLRPNASQAIRHSPRRWVYLWGWFRRFSLSVSHDLAATLRSFSQSTLARRNNTTGSTYQVAVINALVIRNIIFITRSQ